MLLTADIRGFTQNLDVAEARLNKFAVSASKAGASLTRGLGLAFGYVATQSVKAAAEFNRSNTILRQIVGESGIGQLTDEANRLGRESIFMATEVSAAQLELAKLGVRAGEINAVLDRTVKLTTVFGGALDETGEVVAATVRQFGLTLTGREGFENVARVTDVMAAAFKNSALDLTKFREAMKNVGPAAAEVGLSLEDTVSLLAVLANRSIDGSLGGTKLRSTLSDLAKQFPDVGEALDALSQGTLTYSELVELLNKRAALIGAVFQGAGDEINDFKNILAEANGILDDMATGIEDELFFNVEKLKNSFNSIARDIGDSLAPLVKTLAGYFDDLAKSIQDMPEAKLGSIVKGLLLLAATGPALFALGKAITILQRLSGVVTNLSKNLVRAGANANAVRGLLGGPFLAVVAGATLASNEVDKFFQRIQNSNVYFRKLNKDVAELNQKVSDLRTQRELLERQERRTASTSRADLEAFTGVSNEDVGKALAEAEADLRHYVEIRAQLVNKLKQIDESQVSGLEFIRKETEEGVAQQNLYIDALTRLIAIYKAVKAEADSLTKKEEANNKAKEEAFKRTRDEIDQQIQLQNLAAVAGSEPIRVPMADIAFSTLDPAKQLAATLADALGGPEINDVILDIQEIDLPEEEFEYFSDEIVKASNSLVLLRESFEGLKNFAYQFAEAVGQSFLQMRQEGVKFIDALKTNMLKALQALMAQVITLITLYAVLAVLSGGASMAGGGTFGMGFNEFQRSTGSFTEFMAQGLGFTKMRTAGMAMGSEGETGGVKVMGAVSGNNLVLLNQTGPRAYDRTFG